ncbi:hypothetical protein G6F22_020253 [Rhizopus arrhizus]|nr:hypothetical protein G6F22_020253 [Rhizopus arrhizus]KAG1273814.1 hypothetical protein G6F65_010828 [Rhizopus arrhizus]
MEWLGNERGAAMPCRHQLVIDRRHEQIGHSERGQAIGDREHHAVAQLDIQHGAVELPGVEQAQCIEHAVGMRDLVALLLQRLLHQCGQVELVLHQQQVADCATCRINSVDAQCQPGAKCWASGHAGA